MKNILTLFVLLLNLTAFSQTDTSKIYNSTRLNKGFYRNYTDYITNTPFIASDFDLVSNRFSRKDSTIISYGYKFGDIKTRIPNTWGFCDGKDVYCHFPADDLNPFFYKLNYIGPYPFFDYVVPKKLHLSPTVIGMALEVVDYLDGSSYGLFIAAPDNKIKGAFNKHYLKKIFASQPDILNAYNREGDTLNVVKLKQYLTNFNELMK